VLKYKNTVEMDKSKITQYGACVLYDTSDATKTHSECVLLNFLHCDICHATKPVYGLRSLPVLLNCKPTIHKVTTWLDRFVLGCRGRRVGMSWLDIGTVPISMAIHFVVSLVMTLCCVVMGM